MCIETEQDLAGLLRVGRVVALVLAAMEQRVRPGMTTRQLDEVGWKVLREHGARPAPMLTYGFPGMACISVDEEAAHGVPGSRVITTGSVVKIDVSAELDGYWADAAVTVLVGATDGVRRELRDCAHAAMTAGIAAARAGERIRSIGAATEQVVQAHNFRVIRELPGHGVGRSLHEAPEHIPMFAGGRTRERLREGQVITVEPHISTRATRLVTGSDGWTLRVAEGSIAAAFEHTIVVTNGDPMIVTAL